MKLVEPHIQKKKCSTLCSVSELPYRMVGDAGDVTVLFARRFIIAEPIRILAICGCRNEVKERYRCRYKQYGQLDKVNTSG